MLAVLLTVLNTTVVTSCSLLRTKCDPLRAIIEESLTKQCILFSAPHEMDPITIKRRLGESTGHVPSVSVLSRIGVREQVCQLTT